MRARNRELDGGGAGWQVTKGRDERKEAGLDTDMGGGGIRDGDRWGERAKKTEKRSFRRRWIVQTSRDQPGIQRRETETSANTRWS